ncbi:hypothetical protein V6N11_021609 [Hibiscus sabdariffa]|uniref:Uncharacterized protein n=1 Tax=Hibiscus sabdariffa TaxID=183260 RepID=A0ABR2PBV1_9ROSI
MGGHHTVERNSNNPLLPKPASISRLEINANVHGFSDKRNRSMGWVDLDTDGKLGEESWADVHILPNQAQEGVLQDFGRDVEIIKSAPSNPVGGSLIQALAISSEPIGTFNKSPSFEFVPDSFEGLNFSSNLKRGSVEFGESVRCALEKSAEIARKCPRSYGPEFYNSAYRRAVRLVIRDSLEEMGHSAEDENQGSKKGEQDSMKEARAIYEETGLVDLPLKGGAFTWSNMRDSPTMVRLDRFLGPRPFKFFNYHLEEVGFEDMVISKIPKATGGKEKVGILKELKDSKNAIKEWVGD